ncbi:flavin reductase family protein [Spongiactinospora sp. 9N601]|uniref:flavin reductase family protein n=1 Tax=Spongiactinospora sp. 9N601 TaxID=3375149 RepID=UPI0037A2CEAD
MVTPHPQGPGTLHRPVTADEHRQAMRHLATGVAVLTTRHDGLPHAMTLNTVLSVSTRPPTLLVSLGTQSRTHGILHSAACYTVNILASDQRHLAERFATKRPMGMSQFDGVPWEPSPITGNPVLPDGLLAIDCRIGRRIPVADHTLFIGDVLSVTPARTGAAPLVFACGGYETEGR